MQMLYSYTRGETILHQKIFIQAQSQLLIQLRSGQISDRIATIHFQALDNQAILQTLRGRVQKKSRIPAYYDPNTHTVFLNHTVLEPIDVTTIFVICSHELIHAASFHDNWKEEHRHIFQSGVKMEYFSSGSSYACANRLLNEGLVQYFTLAMNSNPPSSYAYAREVSLVRTLVSHLGESVLFGALFHGDSTTLIEQFEACYGFGSFDAFNSLLDSRSYARAKHLIRAPRTILISRSLQEIYASLIT